MTDLRRIFADPHNLIVAPGRLLLEDGPRQGRGVLLRAGRFAAIAPLADLRARHPGIWGEGTTDEMCLGILQVTRRTGAGPVP